MPALPRSSKLPEYKNWTYEHVGSENGRKLYRFTTPGGLQMRIPCADDYEIRLFVDAMLRDLEGFDAQPNPSQAS